MSITRPPLALKKLSRKLGDDIDIITRKETVDSDGRVKYEYLNTISTKALLYAASGFTEFWSNEGIYEGIDYVVTILPVVGEFQYEEFYGDEFYTGVTISPKDYILLSNTVRLEVVDIIPREKGFRLYYWECLCKEVE